MEPFPTSTAAATGKAPLGKRAVALVLDSLIAGAIAGVLGLLGTRMGAVGILLGAAYTLLRDGLTLEFASGRSVGKQLMSLDVLRLDGRPMDIETSIRRNWPLAIGSVLSGLGGLVGGGLGAILGAGVGAVVGAVIGLVEIVLVFTDAQGRRLGDRTAGTEVVEAETV